MTNYIWKPGIIWVTLVTTGYLVSKGSDRGYSKESVAEPIGILAGPRTLQLR